MRDRQILDGEKTSVNIPLPGHMSATSFDTLNYTHCRLMRKLVHPEGHCRMVENEWGSEEQD